MRKTVMLVDDEQDFCYFMKKNLESYGDYDVITTSDSNAGLQQIRRVRPDVILLDVMMPNLSGPDLAALLKKEELTKTIPLVFLTAVIQEEEVRQNEHVIGGWYYLAKPVNMPELVSLIGKLTA